MVITEVRAGAQIDEDVENRAFETADDLCLGLGWSLEVEATQRPSGSAVGRVYLSDMGGEAVGREFFLAEEAGEEATVVALVVKLDPIGAGDIRVGFGIWRRTGSAGPPHVGPQ